MNDEILKFEANLHYKASTEIDKYTMQPGTLFSHDFFSVSNRDLMRIQQQVFDRIYE